MSTNKDTKKENNDGKMSAIQGLLSNPAAISALLTMLKPAGTTAGEGGGQAETGTGGGDFSDKIGQMLSNPDTIKQLPNILSAIGPLLSQTPQENMPVMSYEPADRAAADGTMAADGATDAETTEFVMPTAGDFGTAMSAVDAFSPRHMQKKHTDDKRRTLLLALKPYLGRERGEAIDYIIKITELTYMFKNR